jgi:hypothetical protein
MLKKDHKAHVAANQFDLNTLPVCGAKTRSGGLCKHKGNLRNGRCKRHSGALQGQQSRPLDRVITAMFMALGVKR